MRPCRFSLGYALLICGLCLSATAQQKKVLVIGIDGAGGRYVQEANTPNLDALAANGAARYDFYNEGGQYPNPPNGYGASGVNWSTIVTGASAANHGVVDNSFGGNQFDQFPHFFKHIKDFNSSLFTASYSNWNPINTQILDDQYADDERTGDDLKIRTDAAQLLISGNPDALFLHFDQVDAAGHTHSWGSAQHIQAIQNVDFLVGQVMQSLNQRAGVINGSEDWLVLVTADHGATRGEFGHYASQGEANWEVPFIASGPSVVNGTQMQRGSLRDIASTALWHMGIDPYLAGLDGTVRGLTIDPPSGVAGDINQDGILSGNGTGPAATDDVTAFVQNWRVTGGGSIADRYGRGDLNFDGITDLSDWALLQNASPSLATAVSYALAGITVPEPSTMLLLIAAMPFAVRRR